MIGQNIVSVFFIIIIIIGQMTFSATFITKI